MFALVFFARKKVINPRIVANKHSTKSEPLDFKILSLLILTYEKNQGKCSGSVVERRTPEREVGGSKPTSAVLCP